KVYITGASGTGKSTIAEELNKRNIFSFDIDVVEGLCDWRHKETLEKPRTKYHSGDWLEAHDFFCDVEKLKKLLDVDKEFVVAVGVASNQNDFLHLFDKVFLLQCGEEIFLNRLNARTGEDVFGRGKDEQEYLLGWHKNFEKDLIEHGAIPINTNKQIGKVVDEIIFKIKAE
ncbi:MAG: AAA family ATPase, partial [Candidatus Staskawiczbacteria bacterium]